jgi:hypothetical protein
LVLVELLPLTELLKVQTVQVQSLQALHQLEEAVAEAMALQLQLAQLEVLAAGVLRVIMLMVQAVQVPLIKDMQVAALLAQMYQAEVVAAQALLVLMNSVAPAVLVAMEYHPALVGLR